jgi:hypothetical protein
LYLADYSKVVKLNLKLAFKLIPHLLCSKWLILFHFFIFQRWQPICLRQDGENRSIVRYLGDHMPRGLVFDPFLCYYRTLMASVFTRKSLIREIGSRLPIQPSKRPYFYVRVVNVLSAMSAKLLSRNVPYFVILGQQSWPKHL